MAVEIARELDGTGDTRHAPKIDAARTMLERVQAEPREARPRCAGRPRPIFATLDSDATAEQIEAVFDRWV